MKTVSPIPIKLAPLEQSGDRWEPEHPSILAARLSGQATKVATLPYCWYVWIGSLIHLVIAPTSRSIPKLQHYKQPKWIESIETTDYWEPGLWVIRGWDSVARMKATSVIDTVAVDMTIINADHHRRLVPIGGIALAGARGISKVELQVDDGPVAGAALRTPLSRQRGSSAL